MLTDDIRKLVLAEHELLKSLMLTPQEMAVYESIEKGCEYAAYIADKTKIQACRVHSILSQLHAKGYIEKSNSTKYGGPTKIYRIKVRRPKNFRIDGTGQSVFRAKHHKHLFKNTNQSSQTPG